MAKVSVTIRLDEGFLKAIDEHAEWAGITRTEVMESALERGLADEQSFRRWYDLAGVRDLMVAVNKAGMLEALAKAFRREVDVGRMQALEHRKLLRQRGRRADGGES